MARHKSLAGILINPVSAGPITRHIPGAHAVRLVTSGVPRVKVSGIKPPKPPKAAKVNKLVTGQQQGQKKKAVTKNPRRPLPPPNQKAQQPTSRTQTQQALKVLRTASKVAKPVKPPRVRIINRLSPGHFIIGRGFRRRR